MMIKKGEWLLIIFNLVYIIGFLGYYLNIGNYEFIWYIVIMLVLFGLVGFTLRKTNFNYFILWALSIWGLLHVLGGGLIVKGEVLYALELIPIWVTENFYVLKYDQFVHCYLYFVMIFVIWSLLKKELVKNKNMYLIYPALVLISIGIGALNEIAEFIPVLLFEETGVGGYYNTAWDLVFNFIGAVLGVVVLGVFRKK